MNKSLINKIWIFFFLYTTTASAFIQLILLPYITPSWHAGNGLISSLFDCISFHRMAVDMAHNIHVYGWTAWQFLPQGQSPVGLIAAIYALTFPQPWVIIPLNSFIHATSAIILLRIITLFLPDIKKAVFCVLPFLLYPSAATWYAQIHKDGYFILGIFLVIYGLIEFSRCLIFFKKMIGVVKSFFLFIFGILLVWFVRPYLLQYIIMLCSVVLFSAVIYSLISSFKVKKLMVVLNGGLICLFFTAVLYLFYSQGNPALTNCDRKIIELKTKELTLKSIPISLSLVVQKNVNSIIGLRDGFIMANGVANAKGGIDNTIRFSNASDIFLYLPRAAQVVLFSPFPQFWFSKGSFESNTLMRRICGLEMIGIYFALFFLLFAIWFWRRRIELWIILFFCMSILLLQGLVINNIGTLYRLRYGLLMPLVALGIAGLIKLLENKCAE